MKKIAIFCAGTHGILFYEILKTCNIHINCFVDNSEDKWNKIIVDDVKCLKPDIFLSGSYIVFVCVDRKHYNNIIEEIKKEYQVEIHTIGEVIDNLVRSNQEMYFKVLVRHGLNQSADLIYSLDANKGFVFKDVKWEYTPKIAVYTAVFGVYDELKFCDYLGEGIDLYYISDEKPYNLPTYYIWMDAKEIIPDYIVSPIKRNRFIKMNPHKFLSQYVYSIYIDGNVIISGDISRFLKKSNSGISVFMHPSRDCIYQEALSIVNFKRVNINDVCCQMKKYLDEGMPIHYGLGEMPIIAREHLKKECVSIMETWWEEFENESQRDQLSFTYAMWKNGYKITDLGCLGYDVRNSDDIIFYDHIKESKYIKNIGC